MDSEPNIPASPRVGVVVIGRNEGERLRRCLASASCWPLVVAVVYVDSGSVDDSVEIAKAYADVVELDPAVKFTAARARNTGLLRLTSQFQIDFVQFVDGDCELDSSWIRAAANFLVKHPQAAVACGRRRERSPDASVYNHLCDLEWDTPVGEASACGGDAMIRVAAIRGVGGYRWDLIAGEEPELCVRLRNAGWQIHRLDAEMTLHDANMTQFSQWWRRTVRAGHAYAEGAALHGRSPRRHWVREVRSNWLLGAIVPILALALAWPTWGLSVAMFGLYGLIAFRVWRWGVRRGWASRDAGRYAMFVVIGKFPSAIGQAQYWINRMLGVRSTLIEYKTAAEPVT